MKSEAVEHRYIAVRELEGLIKSAERAGKLEGVRIGLEAAKQRCKAVGERYECKDSGHDPRWCAHCESMSDGADNCFIEIEKLNPFLVLGEKEKR